MGFSVKQVITFIQGEIVGDKNATVHAFAEIEEGIPGATSFLSNPKYVPYLYETQSGIVLVNKDFVPEQEAKAIMVKIDNTYESLAKLLNLYEQSKPRHTKINSWAYVAEAAKIGKGVYIAPFAYIGEYIGMGDNTVVHPHATIGSGAKVGNDCTVYANITIYHDCRIGNRCVLHAGCVTGVDRFGFAPTPEGYEKIPQISVTVLEDDVEIGASTCVDRVTMGATIVHSGVKLDNLIQVTRNDKIGPYTVMAVQMGIAGSTRVDEWCMFGGQVGIAGYIHIGNKVNLGAQSGVPNSIKEGNQLIGTLPMKVKSYLKSQSVFRKLPDIYSKTSALRKELNELKKQLSK